MNGPTHEEVVAKECDFRALAIRDAYAGVSFFDNIRASHDSDAECLERAAAALRSLVAQLKEARGLLDTAALEHGKLLLYPHPQELTAEIESLRVQLSEARQDRERLANAIIDLEPIVNGRHPGTELSIDTMRFIVRSAIDAAKGEENAAGTL